ncbi:MULTISPECIES: hypothetical protein [Klebsiella]|uniref:hypothetical protein n=1 Tax=Klebsiella TaxID=570 RepID=UPI0015E05ED9|nr:MULTISPECIES: hypothetical protein [Klebsiella]MCU8720698.1 hypothetical protein [Klebsiella pneumoniae]MDE8367247.1 hypothetical protein [Klebsiella variicola]WRR65531.1 hypothetical protein SPE70_11150 [Klebsiella sp. ZJOU C1]HBU9202602.1 hypothetical protein [Klebsiella variicola]
MGNEIEQIAQQNEMSIEFVTWFFNEKKVGCGNVWFMMMAAMWEGWKGRSIEMDKLAAENVALKLKGRELLNEASKVYQKYNATIDFYSGDFMDGQTLHEFQFVLDAETSATDAYLAGIKADAITASLDACSDYLETDCAMDRLDISYEEAEKRTSGAMEFHDSIVAIAQQLREGAK